MKKMEFSSPDLGEFLVAKHGFTQVMSMEEDGKETTWSGDKEITEEMKAGLPAYITEKRAEWDAQEYSRKRKAEYDALNQFELISDDANNGTTTHIDAVNAIKTKYPKP